MYEYKATCTRVVDGDTVDLQIDLGFSMTVKQRVRLAHIDTPERGQDGYDQAKAALIDAVQFKTVRVKTTKPSKYGYYLAEISTDGCLSVNSMMIDRGFAKPYEGGAK
jgi:micrococcal nuclease